MASRVSVIERVSLGDMAAVQVSGIFLLEPFTSVDESFRRISNELNDWFHQMMQIPYGNTAMHSTKVSLSTTNAFIFLWNAKAILMNGTMNLMIIPMNSMITRMNSTNVNQFITNAFIFLQNAKAILINGMVNSIIILINSMITRVMVINKRLFSFYRLVLRFPQPTTGLSAARRATFCPTTLSMPTAGRCMPRPRATSGKSFQSPALPEPSPSDAK